MSGKSYWRLGSTFSVYLLMGGLFMLPKKAMSKIGDPQPIALEGVKYQSHANYVEAIDAHSEKLLWHTILYPDIEPKQPDRNLEQDVQWNIISTIKVIGDEIEARDRHGRIYRLNRETGKVMGRRSVRQDNLTELFAILDRLEAEKTWTLEQVQHIASSSLRENTMHGNDHFGVFEVTSGSMPLFRHIELRLARKGTPPKGLIILDLRPERLAVQEVLDRYGKKAAPQLGTTDGHDRSVYYEYKRSSGIIRFGAADMDSKWIANIVIDRFDEMKGDNPTVSTTREPKRATFGLLGHSTTREEFETFVKGLKRIDGTDSEIEGTGGGASGYEALDAKGMRYQVHIGNGSWPSWVEQVKNEKAMGKQKESPAIASASGKEKVSGQLIETAEFTGVLFPSGKKAFLHTVDSKLVEYAYPWDPSQNDIVAAEKAVQLYLGQHAPRILKKLKQYTRQYAGIAVHRNRLIHMNFFCDDMGRRWMSEEVGVKDGGDCYFQVNYSVSYGKVVDFTVNGAS